MYLKDEIKKRRIALGLKQAGFAAMMGVSNQTISRWESGQANPSPEKMIKLAELFKVKPEYLASLPNRAETKLDILCQNLPSAAGYLSGILLQGFSLGIFPYLGLSPSDVLTIIAQIEEVKLDLQKRLKKMPTREQILEQFPENQVDNVAVVYDSIDSLLTLPQYSYKMLKRCSFEDYPRKNVTARTVNKYDFLQRMSDLPTPNAAEPELFAIKQDEPFYLTKSGINAEKPFIVIRQNQPIIDGKLYLYSYDGLSELVRITETNEKLYTFSTDRIEKTIAKEFVENHECRIIGRVVDWA